MTMGARIRRLRTKAGLTQQELAVQCDTAVTQVSRWENDSAEPSITKLRALAKVLGATYEEIVGRS